MSVTRRGWWIGIGVMTLTLAATTAGAQSRRMDGPSVTIYVGPNAREGFVDTDSGIVESINDIQSEIARLNGLRLVPKASDATIELLVMARRLAGQSGSMTPPIGTIWWSFPVKRRGIDTLLRVGKYEKALTSEDENNSQWKAAARQVVRDVVAWVNANWASLPK